MKDWWKFIALCVVAFAVLISGAFTAREERIKERDAECERLKKIGAHRGESVIVYGDMPTWKLECLFDNGGE